MLTPLPPVVGVTGMDARGWRQRQVRGDDVEGLRVQSGTCSLVGLRHLQRAVIGNVGGA